MSSVNRLGTIAWEDAPTAPKNGTVLRLLVLPDEDAHTSFHDSSTPYETIGFNNLADTGDDEWHFAGWDWSHDCITQGRGEVIGWLPFAHPAQAPTSELVADIDVLLDNCHVVEDIDIAAQHEAVKALVRELASPRPKAVTDDMVERALERWFLGEDIADCHEEMHEEWRKDMRATLQAALHGSRQTITDEMVNRAYEAFVAACEWSDWDEQEVRGYLRTALTAAIKESSNDQ